ncbi:MAG: ACP S-malonyltransferase [Halothiobacillaceae bacterium]
MRASFAAVFPGQGSQSVGMLSAWAEGQPVIAQTFREASEALGYDLWRIVSEGPDAELNRTEVTQPAMLAAGVSAWRVWQAEGGPMPLCMAGHSLGEYTALVCAGSIDFADGVRLVAERGRLMQAAVPEGQGAMAAVLGLEDDVVRAACLDASQGTEVVEAVNFNSPGQVVIAGSAAAVARASALLAERGAKRVVPLPVSVPSHSSLMREAAEKMAKVLESVEIRSPAIPVLHNVDAAEHADPAALRAALVRQLHSPVLWVDSVRAMRARGAKALVEFGPGKVLVGLAKRIARELSAYPVFDAATFETAMHATKEPDAGIVNTA